MKFKVFQDTSISDTEFKFFFTHPIPDLQGWYEVIDDDDLLIIPDHETNYIGEYTTP